MTPMTPMRGHRRADTHWRIAAHRLDSPTGHMCSDAHVGRARGGTYSRTGHELRVAQPESARAGLTLPAAKFDASPKTPSLPGSTSTRGQCSYAAQFTYAPRGLHPKGTAR